MTVFSTNIDISLNDGETERWVIDARDLDAIRAEITATGQPYDVDIATAPQPQNSRNFDANNFTSVMPFGAETVRDTNTHRWGTAATERTVYVEITNNAGQSETFTGSIATHGRNSVQSVTEFLAEADDVYALAYRDGQALLNLHKTSLDPLDLTASDAPQPDDSSTYAQHDGTGANGEGLYRSDSNNSQWVKVEDNTTTISY